MPLREALKDFKTGAFNAEDKLGCVRKVIVERPDITMRPDRLRMLHQP